MKYVIAANHRPCLYFRADAPHFLTPELDEADKFDRLTDLLNALFMVVDDMQLPLSQDLSIMLVAQSAEWREVKRYGDFMDLSYD